MEVSLETKLSALPREPGVYIFKDSGGRIIYVGKALVLRNRVRSYFQQTNDGRYQFDALVSRIADVEVITTDTEMEALILESNLIRRYKPRYNIDLRDDKSYPFLRITNEQYPRIFLTRKPVDDGSKYFGPYSDLRYLKGLLHVLRGMLNIRTCNLPLTEEGVANKRFKSCLEFHIGRCNAPCIANESRAEYEQRILDFKTILAGKGSEAIFRLQEDMERLSAEMKFEQAAQIRDWLSALDGLKERQKIISAEPVDRDIIGLAVEDDDGCLAVMQIRAGRMWGRVDYRLRHLKDRPLPEILEEALQNYYSDPVTAPSEIMLPFEPAEIELLAAWLKKQTGYRVDLKIPERGEKVQMVDLAKRNAELLLGEYRIAKQMKERIPASLTELKSRLSLAKLPRNIVAFDISNLQGTETVASMVVFQNGKPARSEYRRFKIKTVEGQDDFASMHEVVSRRFSRLQREESPFPDLVLIDGGKGQLAAAVQALKELNILEQPILGLAKKIEEIYLPGESLPHNLPRTSSALRVLQQIRDEAHRFAITYHRNLRQKTAIHSQLEDIEGVGPARRKAIFNHFKSINRIAMATVEELQSIQGISPEIARRIHEYFAQRQS